MQYLKKLTISSNHKETFIEITRLVKDVLRESKINEGLLTVYTPHTTAAITVNENADPDVLKDLVYAYQKTFPNDQRFKHVEGNSDAHLKSTLTGVSETFIISQRKVLLGIWQGIYFCEFDGPRSRTVYIKILGE